MNRFLAELELPDGGVWLGKGPGGFTRSFETALSVGKGRPSLLEVEGVFGVGSTLPRGETGLVVSVRDGSKTTWSAALACGRHFDDPGAAAPVTRFNGDGSWVETVGSIVFEGKDLRLDRVSIELPGGLGAKSVVIGALDGRAGFWVTALRANYVAAEGCPFHSSADAVPLRDIGPVLRTGDRLRFDAALDQLRASVFRAESDDEARSLGLTFVAVVGAAMLELGGPKRYHMAQLDAARELLAAESREEVARLAVRHAARLAEPALPQGCSGVDPAIARALQIVMRRHATRLTEGQVAAEVGYSASHFRFLFRRDAGVAFHRYLMAVRLEKARELLLTTEDSVSEIASETGFSSASHFSRSFTARFGNPPSAWRRTETRAKTRQSSHSVA